MKRLLPFIFFFLCKISSSQNGWSAYLSGTVTGFYTGLETSLLIDNSGNKWVGFTNPANTSPAAVAKYHILGGFWTYYNMTNTPAFLSNRVQAMTCDNAGNVWIGTDAGLVKYDGTNFTSLTTLNGLPSNNILALESINNMLYVGTPGGGLTRYDGTTFFNYNTSNGFLGNDTVYSIKAENANNLWLGISNRLVLFNINATYTSSSFINYHVPFSGGKINCIHIDASNNKWLGTLSKGIITYDNTNFTLATSTYSNLISNTSYTATECFLGGAFLPTNCQDMTKGPNNGVLITASCVPYYSPTGPNITTCLLELLPNGQYKIYYESNSNYSLGSFIETDPNGEIFISNGQLVHLGGFLKFMFSFDLAQYDGFLLGPGYGITNNNFKFLDINRVKAGIDSRGDMFWDIGGGGNALYEVPKGSNVSSGFAGSLWIGATDGSNQIHTAINTYKQTGWDFWPGPLDTVNVTIDTNTVKTYDKVWKVNYRDINNFITNFNNGNIANNTYTPTTDIITWPAKGTGNNSRNLAPFMDINHNGIYDPLTGGDYPQIKGDEALYYITNDKLGPHGESGGAALGIEIHTMAYAYGCDSLLNGNNELAYTTFYDYKIINRSTTNYHDMYIGFWTDIDLGYWNDDLIACEIQDNLGFIYNGDGYDETSSTPGYLNYPPSAGVTVLKGPIAPLNDGVDNNNNGLIDEPNEDCLMNKFLFYTNQYPAGTSPLATQTPSFPVDFYNLLKGQWKDSTSLTCGGNCYGGTTPTSFVYPWNSYPGNPCSLWADGVTIPKGDRRFIISSGPFNLNAQQSTEIEYAYVWSVDSSTANNNIGSAIKLISDAQKVRTYYNTNNQSACLPNMMIGIKEQSSLANKFVVYPNPANSILYIKSDNSLNGNLTIEIEDVFGKKLLCKQVHNLNNQSIDVALLSDGVYFVTLTANGSQAVKKFIKQ